MGWGSAGADLRMCARRMRRRPLLPAAAVAIVAGALGTAIATTKLAEAVLHSPLAYRDAGNIAVASEPTSEFLTSTYTWQPHPQAGEICAATGEIHLESAFWGTGVARRRLTLGFATPGFFKALDVPMVLGQALADVPPPRPDRPLSWLPLVASHHFWQDELGASPAILGHQVHIARLYPYTFLVVGVAPAGFGFPRGVDGWVPEQLVSTSDIQTAARPNWERIAVCRLREGVTLQSAEGAMQTWQRRLPDWYWSGSTQLTPLREYLGGELYRVLPGLRLLALVFLELAVITTAGLYLRDVEERSQELWTRCILGGGTGRVLRMLAIELGLVFLLAIPAAWLASQELLWLGARLLPWTGAIGGAGWLDAGLAGTAVAGVGLLVLAPTGLGMVRRLQRRRAPRARWLGGALQLSAQVACASVIMIVAIVLLLSSRRIAALPLGLNPQGVFVCEVSLPLYSGDFVYGSLGKVPYKQRAGLVDRRSRQLRHLIAEEYARVARNLRGRAGVVDAGAISVAPFSGYAAYTDEVFVTRTMPAGPPYHDGIQAHLVSLSAGAARTLGLHSVYGNRVRTIGARGQFYVNQAMAKLLGGNGAAMGKFVAANGLGHPGRIVGVVGNVHETDIFAAPIPTIYYPFANFGIADSDVVVRMRAGATAEDARSAVLGAASSATAGAVVSPATAMRDMVAKASRTTSATAAFLTWIGLLGLGMVALAVWSEAAARVRRGAHDFAVRLALGAAPGRLAARLVLRQAAATLAAVVAGALAALGFSRSVAFLYHGYSPGTAGFLAAGVAVEIYVLGVSGWALLRGLRQDPRALLSASERQTQY